MDKRERFIKIQKEIFKVLFEMEKEKGYATYGDVLSKARYNQSELPDVEALWARNILIHVIEQRFDVKTLTWRYNMCEESHDFFRKDPELGPLIAILEKKTTMLETDARILSSENEQLRKQLDTYKKKVEESDRIILMLKDAVTKLSNQTHEKMVKEYFAIEPGIPFSKNMDAVPKTEVPENVSAHWKKNVRYDNGGMVEWICPHGIGHYEDGSAHGCDGCCKREDFPKKKRR